MITVPTRERMLDEGIWPGGDKWIGRRFYDLRAQPGQESKWQFVSTSSDHYGFGHGKHACPGRFFASNEAKVILVHVLMKYDWKFLPGQERPKSSTRGSENLVDPKAILMYKSRKSEIQFPGEKISPSVG
jgi:cytochrome P450